METVSVTEKEWVGSNAVGIPQNSNQLDHHGKTHHAYAARFDVQTTKESNHLETIETDARARLVAANKPQRAHDRTKVVTLI